MPSSSSSESSPSDPPARSRRARRPLQTTFGWVAGASLGVIVSFLVALVLDGDDFPLVPVTFGSVVAGCFAGMWLSDRVGPRGFRFIGVAAGCLLSLALLVVALMLASGE